MSKSSPKRPTTVREKAEAYEARKLKELQQSRKAANKKEAEGFRLMSRYVAEEAYEAVDEFIKGLNAQRAAARLKSQQFPEPKVSLLVQAAKKAAANISFEEFLSIPSSTKAGDEPTSDEAGESA